MGHVYYVTGQRKGRPTKGVAMQIILSDFMSLDGVVQAPGGRELRSSLSGARSRR